MKFISLFTGAGGLDLGFEAAGWECVYQVELNKWCYQTLERHWPNVPKQKDIRNVNGADLPFADVIAFGSPCQDLSRGGKETGIDGAKSSLFYEATRVIKEMRDASQGQFPKYAIWENVPGAFSANGGADFGKVLDTLAEVGALGIEWTCLDAQHFGVPQHRLRLFVLACFNPDSAIRGGEQVFNVQHVGRRYIATSSDSIETGIDQVPVVFGGGRSKIWKERLVTTTLCATDEKSPSNVVLHEYGIRKLVPLEYERLMGWPEGHTAYRANGKTNSDTTRYRMCGNGVVAPVATWVAQQVDKIGL